MLANRIIQFREHNKLSVETLANLLNVSADDYLNYENGSVSPDIATITELAKIYKVTVNEFYGPAPRLTLQTNEPNDDEFQLSVDVLKFSELSIDEKELVLKYRLSENKEEILKFIEEK